MHKHEQSDIKNCTACGYGTCEAMAKAIHNGLNFPENCHWFQHEEILLKQEEVLRNHDQLVKIAQRVTSSIREMVDTISDQDEKITSQSADVTESSAAIEQMITNIQSIATNLSNSAEEFDRLTSTVNHGAADIEQLKAIVAELARKSDLVIEANKVLNQISARTNLLAMNSAIEAAHAGEHGRGFAVVADEIRKLAESANQQSRRIADVIQELKTSVQSVTSISENTNASFAAIAASVETVTGIEQQIKDSLDEQASGSTEILTTLSDINRITTDVHAGSAAMLKGGRSVLEEIGELAEATDVVES